MRWYPSRAASATRCGSMETRRTSPDSATSPIARTSGGTGTSHAADATAIATARSTPGSASRAPPTVATKTSLSASLSPLARSVTASSMAVRAESRPLTPRRGLGVEAEATRDWISASMARRPSTATARQVPGTGTSR